MAQVRRAIKPKAGYRFGRRGRYGTDAASMIRLTRLNGQPIAINPEVIESLEATPDTHISLASGQKFSVLESVEEVEEKFIQYQRRKFWRPDLKDIEPRAVPANHVDDENR